MTDEEFEKLVAKGIDAIPERFINRLQNVAIVTSRTPTTEQLMANHVPKGSTLFGLYEGIPLTHRGDVYGTGEILPDKITIFKNPIVESAGGDPASIARIVRDTVWHEVAHYFGYGDEEISKREGEGLNHSER